MSGTKTNATDLITSFNDIALPAQKRAVMQGVKTAPEPSKYWANFGVVRNDKLVGLPSGIALDKLQARKIPGPATKNPEFRQLRQAEAQLWEKIQETLAALKPGERVRIPIVMELYHVADQEAVEETETGENPFAVGDFF